MSHWTYLANFLIETKYLRDEVLFVDQKGVGNIYILSVYPKKTKLIKFDETAICWLALAIISIENEKRQTHHSCIFAGCIYRAVNKIQLLLATTSII